MPADVRLWNSSLLASTGPVIESEGALVRVLVDGCVIAPSGTAQATLAAVDNPRNLVCGAAPTSIPGCGHSWNQS